MKLSVILPCFNGASTIALQLEALTTQSWPDGWELVVANNGSTDASMAIVETFRSRLPSLTIAEAHVPGTPRLGVPHSYNKGIEAATGDAFVFCEADDEVAPGWLAAMGQAMTQHDFVAARMDHRKLNPDWLQPTEGDGYQSKGLTPVNCAPFLPYASGCSFGLRRSLYEKVGPLSTAFSSVHDTEYCWRAQLAGFKLHFEPSALVYYREKSDYKSMYRQGKNWGRDFTRLLQRYGSPLGQFALPRQLVAIARSMPSGVKALISYGLGRPQGNTKLAQWVWGLGWSMGKLTAIVKDPVVEPREGLPMAADAVPGTSGRVRS